MAQEDNSWWSSWTSGILENVREKTSTALEFVQNDLSEFVTTIQHDASVAIADSATAVNTSLKVDESEKDAPTGKLKQGFSSLLTSISTTLHQAVENSSEPASSQEQHQTDEQRSTTTVVPVYGRTQARLQEVQTNPETYRSDPAGEGYQTWCRTFDLDVKKGEISELLVNNPDVRRLYTKFVPSVQSHSTFWHRYFYKVHELELENKRLADIVARANQSETHEQDLGWDDEDEEDTRASPTLKGVEVSLTADSKVVRDASNISPFKSDIESNEISQEELERVKNVQESEQTTLSAPKDITVDEGSLYNTQNLSVSGQSESSEKRTIGDNNENDQPLSFNSKTGSLENIQQSSVLTRSIDTKQDEYKSDSSESSSWIRVSDKEDKEGSSSNSSSSVVVVNEKEKELCWADNDDDPDKDDDDDDLDLNEDISSEDVEKLVQSITANELDPEEDEWEDWE